MVLHQRAAETSHSTASLKMFEKTELESGELMTNLGRMEIVSGLYFPFVV